MKVAVIGGGAAGLMAAGSLCEKGISVSVFDGNEKLGKKLYITGKGRCNFSNLCERDIFFENVVNGGKFLLSAIFLFSPKDCIDFFEGCGLKTKVERGGRVFPLSDKASDVTKALAARCKNCEFHFSEQVIKIEKACEGFNISTYKKNYQFDKVIVATGGESYSQTGSQGDGYKFARKFGHKIITPVPALVPIKLNDGFLSSVQGLSLKNATLSAKTDKGNFSFFGEMLFTDKGISGPITLSLSSYINRAKKVELSLDFKPALSEEQLDARLLRDFESNKNKNISFIMRGLLPNNFVDIFLKRITISSEKKVNSVTVQERKLIVNKLKNFNLSFAGLYPIDFAIVTSGGVDTKEINPKTMESKLVKGLYFIGEVLDVDCLTGGFNLQTAFATAQSAARAIGGEKC